MRTAIDAIRATPSRISRLYLASKPSPPGRHCITNSIHRQYTSPTTPSPDPLLDLIQQSPDLRSRDEASQELRWIRDEVRSSLQSRAAELFGSDIGSDALGSGSSTLGDKEVQLEIESISALRGVEEGIVRGLVERRAKGEPLQYVLGNTDFGPLTLLCKRPTLIPRPETAHIITLFAERLLSSTDEQPSSSIAHPIRILDLCTGSGCMSLLLSHLLSKSTPSVPRKHTVLGVDISPHAIRLADENLALVKKANTPISSDVEFVTGDIFSPDFCKVINPSDSSARAKRNPSPSHGSLPAFDLIVSNPPYIPMNEYQYISPSVLQYEDLHALLGLAPATAQAHASANDKWIKANEKGLAFYLRIAQMIPALLRTSSSFATPTGEVMENAKERMDGREKKTLRVLLEIGADQGEAVRRILEDESGGVIVRTEVWEDQYGRPRGVVGFTAG